MGFKDLEVSSGGNDFIKTPVGETRIRIVSDAELFWKNFDTKNTYLTKEAAMKDDKAKPAYAVWAIDRADGNKIKIWNFAGSVARDLKALANHSEYGFDGMFPYDIIVNRVGSTQLDTRYSITPSRQNTALTEAEAKEVAALQPMRMKLREDAEDASDVAPF